MLRGGNRLRSWLGSWLGTWIGAVALWLLLPSAAAGEGAAPEASAPSEMVSVPEGVTPIGSERGLPDERPVFEARVAAFRLDRHPVTVGAFRRFVHETGFVSQAERFGDAAVFDMAAGRWQLVAGAVWHHPRGPEAPPAPDDHPVTQVSWDDAVAYCHHRGKRLPREVEWEHAARNARGDAYPVYSFGGEELVVEGAYLANVWQGLFPRRNRGEDGYLYTSPVGAFGATPLGLTDMAGNVWEWTDDWYRPYAQRGTPFEPDASSERVQRGGSFLCDEKVCHGYRVSARGHSTPETSLLHVGFRCAADAAPVSARRPAAPGW